jgi:hypothetical protein
VRARVAVSRFPLTRLAAARSRLMTARSRRPETPLTQDGAPAFVREETRHLFAIDRDGTMLQQLTHTAGARRPAALL